MEGGRRDAGEAGFLSAKTHVELRGETRLEAKNTHRRGTSCTN